MTTINEAFEALMPRADLPAWAGVGEGFVRHDYYTADQMRQMFDAATERAAKQERDKAAELLTALKGLSEMYARAWDLEDGGLMMMGESIPLFEKRHKAASKAIERVYREAAQMEKETGIPHAVDHYYPLQGRRVSGLHVAANLQVLTAQANLKKHNRYEVGHD